MHVAGRVMVCCHCGALCAQRASVWTHPVVLRVHPVTSQNASKASQQAACARQEPTAAPQTAGVAFDDFVVRAAPERVRAADPVLEAAGPSGPYASPAAHSGAASGGPRGNVAPPWEAAWPPAPQLGAQRDGVPGAGARGIPSGGPPPARDTYRVVPQAAGEARAVAPPLAEQAAWPARQAAPGGAARE